MQKKSEIFKKRYFLGLALCISRVDFFFFEYHELKLKLKLKFVFQKREKWNLKAYSKVWYNFWQLKAL